MRPNERPGGEATPTGVDPGDAPERTGHSPGLSSEQAMPLLRATSPAPKAAASAAPTRAAPTPRGPSSPRRWLVAAAVVATAVLVIAGALTLQPTGHDQARTAPAGPDRTTAVPTTDPDVEVPPPTVPGDESTTGLLLPEGVPSAPHAGELVASLLGQYVLYADGRLLSVAAGPAGGWQWVERRITPEGVERLRRELLATRVFDGAEPSQDLHPLCTCVRDDAGVLRVLQNPGPARLRLETSMRALESSLTESEWVERVADPYVASRIAVCVGTFADAADRVVRVPHAASVLVPLLPAPAAALLGGREPSASPFHPPEASCFEVTLDEARTLADELQSPSVGGSHEYSGIVLRDRRFDAVDPAVREGIVVYVSFDPLLPDGAPVVTGG